MLRDGITNVPITLYSDTANWVPGLSTTHFLRVRKGGTSYYVGLTTDSGKADRSNMRVRVDGDSYYVMKVSKVVEVTYTQDGPGHISFTIPSGAVKSQISYTCTLYGGGAGDQGGGGGGGGAAASASGTFVRRAVAGGTGGRAGALSNHGRTTGETFSNTGTLDPGQQYTLQCSLPLGHGSGGTGGSGQGQHGSGIITIYGHDGYTGSKGGNGPSATFRKGGSNGNIIHSKSGQTAQESTDDFEFRASAVTNTAIGGHKASAYGGYGGAGVPYSQLAHPFANPTTGGSDKTSSATVELLVSGGSGAPTGPDGIIDGGDGGGATAYRESVGGTIFVRAIGFDGSTGQTSDRTRESAYATITINFGSGGGT